MCKICRQVYFRCADRTRSHICTVQFLQYIVSTKLMSKTRVDITVMDIVSQLEYNRSRDRFNRLEQYHFLAFSCLAFSFPAFSFLAFSCLAFSCHVFWCRLFMSRIFMSRIFSVPNYTYSQSDSHSLIKVILSH